jgi:electron transport complex protein RnfG
MSAVDAMEVPKEPGPVHLVGTLTLAGLLSGVLLTTAYLWTLPQIEANRAAALRAAVFQVVPGTASMQKLVLRGDQFALADGSERPTDIAIYATYDEAGKHLGYAIPSAGPGFADTISLIYGYDPVQRCVVGMQILESRETPGLGDKIFKDPKFGAEFQKLAVEPAIVVVKNGAGTKPNEVDGITGATISSKAVVKIVNAGNEIALAKLPAAERVPPAPRKEGGR